MRTGRIGSGLRQLGDVRRDPSRLIVHDLDQRRESGSWQFSLG